MVRLVSVGHIGTVVLVVLMAVFINVLVVVTLISNQVIVYVGLLDEHRQRLTLPVPPVALQSAMKCTVVWHLVRVVQQRTVVTMVTNSIHVGVLLIGVVHEGAVVALVHNV